jgi:hypothetical protein
MKKFARRVLAVTYYVTLVLVVAMPIVLDASRRQFVVENAELEGMHWIHVTRVGDLGWQDGISGELGPEHVAEFMQMNDLRPVSRSDFLWPREGDGHFGDWERHWPAHAQFYARERPRANARCLYGCNVYCLVDSVTGRIWVAVEMPDFAGG